MSCKAECIFRATSVRAQNVWWESAIMCTMLPQYTFLFYLRVQQSSPTAGVAFCKHTVVNKTYASWETEDQVKGSSYTTLIYLPNLLLPSLNKNRRNMQALQYQTYRVNTLGVRFRVSQAVANSFEKLVDSVSTVSQNWRRKYPWWFIVARKGCVTATVHTRTRYCVRCRTICTLYTSLEFTMRSALLTRHAHPPGSHHRPSHIHTQALIFIEYINTQTCIHF